MYFWFSVIFSFLGILHFLQCAFLIFHVFQWFHHYSRCQVDVSHFHYFQFSCHIPRPTVDISKFSSFFSFPRHIWRPKVCISQSHGGGMAWCSFNKEKVFKNHNAVQQILGLRPFLQFVFTKFVPNPASLISRNLLIYATQK